MKQILVIGGTYFAGRVYSILTSRGEAQRNDLHLHLVNRGRYPLKGLDNVSQYVCDRHQAELLPGILPKDMVYDAVVDFCGYEPGDISSVIDALPGRIRQYVFISTCSVYEPGGHDLKTESSPVLKDFDGGTVDDYIQKKALLEEELKASCKGAGIEYTILRPAFIYGPFNYAPRESWFVQQICQGNPIPFPADASAGFSFVYVMDVADVINLCISDTRAYGQVFNLASPESQTYGTFMDTLKACTELPVRTYDVTVEQVLGRNLPLPFPLDGDELYSGEKVTDTFGYRYTPFLTGMKKTVSVFTNVYKQ